jgi:hypothetical protein
MKKILKIIWIVLGVLVIFIAAALVYVKAFLPNVGQVPELQVESTTERLDHGKYLANHVMVCIDCHSLRNWELFSGPPIPGTEGGGGEVFGREFGFPGVFISPNITPHNLSYWSDGELFRAITTGVTKDNKAIFPVMPYLDYGKLDEYDILAVIAYIRSLPSIESSFPERELDFPMNFMINTIPKSAFLTKRPDPIDQVAYGKYVITAAACTDCHTKAVKGKIVGEYLAGGFEFKFPDGSTLRSSNITKHSTGIGKWDREFFINRFKAYIDPLFPLAPVGPGEFQTAMPWFMYAGMSTEDLGSIFDYLETLPPVDNLVERFTPAGL